MRVSVSVCESVRWSYMSMMRLGSDQMRWCVCVWCVCDVGRVIVACRACVCDVDMLLVVCVAASLCGAAEKGVPDDRRLDE